MYWPLGKVSIHFRLQITQYFGQNYVENKTVPKMSNKKWFKIWPEWTKDFYLKFFKTFFSFLHLKKFSHEIAM